MGLGFMVFNTTFNNIVIISNLCQFSWTLVLLYMYHTISLLISNINFQFYCKVGAVVVVTAW
jgi:hypothetical protein